MPAHVQPRHLLHRCRYSRSRWTVAAWLAAAVAVVPAVLTGFVPDPLGGWGRTPTSRGLDPLAASSGVPGSASTPAPDRWAALLARLDERRDQAWRSGRPAALSQVFVVDSPPWYADRVAMRGYLERGYAVDGARMRFWDVQVVSRTANAVRLRTVDRLADGSVRVAGHGVAGDEAARERVACLPRDRLTRHLITLARTSGGWRISAVHAV